ncbi:MAG: type IX secretion system sortase PorU [Paludibacteraceae bacterium]|nr:type IX secretion system sortase PorU [Paludibacteraceae bacterium]MDD6747898.1 type IX secretion system sortase PorU [Paludibacteraceae bacterium]
MKKILFIAFWVLVSLPMMAGIHSYAERSVLADGHWVKIRVSESGVCRMSFSELRSAGLEPSQVRVFGYGGAQKEQDFSKPNIDDLPQVPVYVGEDYILFYVQGPISWTYNGSRFAHTRNTYSDFGYYLLSDDAGDMLLFPEAEAVSGSPTDVTYYSYYQVQDEDSVNLIDRTGVSGGGRTFYGEQFAAGQTRTFTFSTPYANGDNSSVYIDMAANAATTSTVKAKLNNTSSKSIYISSIPDHYTFGVAGTISMNGASEEQNQRVTMQFVNSNASALAWLNYIEITTPSELVMTGSYMGIRSLVNRNTTNPVRFLLRNTTASTQIWDVTDLAAIQRMPTTMVDDQLAWVGTQADGVHEYIAVNTDGTKFVQAEVVGEVKNQNLHALSNIDYIIICPEGYEDVSEDLAKAHEAKQAITYAIVTDQQVYNEFSSGTPDATAYRWLMKMLYDRAKNGIGQQPRWLLLMGHGTFDNRKLLRNSGTSLLLTYQSKNSVNEIKAYATDDYFAYLDDNEGTIDTQGRMDIGVGRLPVESLDEARTTVDKLIQYIRNEQTGKWKNQLVYLADDGENGTHTETAEKSAELVRIKNPDFIVHKIFLDAYPQEVNASGESYPLAKNRVLNLLKNGVLFFNYSGHGGYNAITNESILNLKDIAGMTNKNQAFWLFATCNFAQCDAGKRSAAETAVLNPKGGAIGILAATRTVYASQNTNLNRSVCDTLFGHSDVFHYDMTLGEAISIGKNLLGSDENKLAYVLLGDPCMRLNYPTDYHVETLTEMDTLNALSVQHVEGRIIDEDLNIVSDFNGKVDITIYDKMQSIPTRDNDNAGGDPRVIAYNDYPNTIFSGATDVKDGLFNYTFMVPKDIRYNFDNGRIVYYAVTADSLETAEAVGHFEQFIIGGTGSTVAIDTIGPEMEIYLNSPAFRNGDKTYATPRFFANLYDKNGINTAGAGIGHDLMLIIDDDPKMIYSLNEYFTAANNSYQAGQVSYLMEELANGPHSLTFRAWDLLNNSTTKSLNFIVEAGLDPSIYNVTTYPNPVQQSGVVHLIVNYDQPDELIKTEIYLYNTAGQMVYSHKQDNPDAVSINLPSLGLNTGVYIYSVKIKSASSKYSTTSGKIIVTK